MSAERSGGLTSMTRVSNTSGLRTTRRVQTDEPTEVWTAEDRVLAVAHLLADVWVAAGVGRALLLQSAVVALDTAQASGNGLVVVTIDLHPDETELIGDSIDRAIASHPSWRATWRQQVLEIIVTAEGCSYRSAGRCSRRS